MSAPMLCLNGFMPGRVCRIHFQLVVISLSDVGGAAMSGKNSSVQDVAFDISRLFKATDALKARCRAQIHALGEIHIGNSAVALQYLQNLAIDHI
jgi:hypothetical protein